MPLSSLLSFISLSSLFHLSLSIYLSCFSSFSLSLSLSLSLSPFLLSLSISSLIFSLPLSGSSLPLLCIFSTSSPSSRSSPSSCCFSYCGPWRAQGQARIRMHKHKHATSPHLFLLLSVLIPPHTRQLSSVSLPLSLTLYFSCNLTCTLSFPPSCLVALMMSSSLSFLSESYFCHFEEIIQAFCSHLIGASQSLVYLVLCPVPSLNLRCSPRVHFQVFVVSFCWDVVLLSLLLNHLQ